MKQVHPIGYSIWAEDQPISPIDDDDDGEGTGEK